MKNILEEKLSLSELTSFFESEKERNNLKLNKGYEVLKIDSQKNVEVIRMDNVKSLNKMSFQLQKEYYNLVQTYLFSKGEDKVKILIGDKTNRAFCAGGDLFFFYEKDQVGLLSAFQLLNYIFYQCSKAFSQNSVTIWNGITMGAGVALGIYSEFRVATETSVLSVPQAKFGFFANCFFNNFISKFVTKHEAMHMALLCHRFESYELYLKKFANYFILNKYLDAVILDIQKEPEKLNSILLLYHNKSIQEYAEEIKKYETKIKLFEEMIQNIYYNFEYEKRYFFDFYEKFKYYSSDKYPDLLEEFYTRSLLSLKSNYNVVFSAYENLSFEELYEEDCKAAKDIVLSGNMSEGIRAYFVDKDKRPRWTAKF